MPKYNQKNNFDDKDNKKMSGFAKLISGLIVLLLIGGLVLSIFAFVDHSNKANERLADQKQEERDKKKEKTKEQKDKKKEKSTEETNQTQQNKQTHKKQKVN